MPFMIDDPSKDPRWFPLRSPPPAPKSREKPPSAHSDNSLLTLKGYQVEEKLERGGNLHSAKHKGLVIISSDMVPEWCTIERTHLGCMPLEPKESSEQNAGEQQGDEHKGEEINDLLPVEVREVQSAPVVTTSAEPPVFKPTTVMTSIVQVSQKYTYWATSLVSFGELPIR
ncbi:MAG: hypothetical protein Q9222_002401 [Ikaeria aurantiellina]